MAVSYKNILVAVDVSSAMNTVLQTAVSMSKHYGANVSVLHVAAHPVTGYGQQITKKIDGQENQIREHLFTRLANGVERVSLSRSVIRIDFGPPVETIISHAESGQVDLIVIGSHGYHGVRAILGSTANRVLHHAVCDVLAVRVD